jgi:hypothetical protein
VIEPEIRSVLEAVPEFVDRYLELVESADGDPGAAAAFTELADFVADRLSGPKHSPALVARSLAAIEKVARESDDAEALVGWAFLDSFSADDLRRLQPWLGPQTLTVAAAAGAAEIGGPHEAEVPP